MKRSVAERCNNTDQDKKAKVVTTSCTLTSNISTVASSALQNIVGEQSTEYFFQELFQEKPSLFNVNKNDMTSTELASIYSMGCDDLAHMLETSQMYLNRYSNETGFDSDTSSLPLIFRHQEALQPVEVKDAYGNSPFAAYLDGCSIVNNHADLINPALASLCQDLQRSFPHVYVNTYLTPPKAAAVKAHSDDRDVFVIQIIGEKQWKVYDDVPILYPYTNEQVGKGNLPVPDSTLKKKPLLDITLKSGDVLYMPRGYVHEAFTKQDSLSFHATVAIATHDWSISKTISSIVRQQLDKEPDFRRAVNPRIGTQSLNIVSSRQKTEMESILKRCMKVIEAHISVESIASHLGRKYDIHNTLVKEKRNDLIRNMNVARSEKKSAADTNTRVGPEAARLVVFASGTRFRASTPEERSSAPAAIACHGKGLTVRNETCDFLLSILATLKNDKEKTFTLRELRGEMKNKSEEMICDFTLLSFVRCCVELGAMSVIITPDTIY